MPCKIRLDLCVYSTTLCYTHCTQVYHQTLKAAGVPDHILAAHERYLTNMVGLVRGNLYYNLMSWYRCLSCLPLGDTSKYMETMMGVKQV